MKHFDTPELERVTASSTRRLGSTMLALAIIAAGAANAAEEIVLTSLQGSARIGTTPLESHGPLEGKETVQLESGARSSFLIGDFAVVDLSDEAELRFHRLGGGGLGELELRAGTLVLTLDGSAAGRSLEIRTPGAMVSVPTGVVELRVERKGALTTVVGREGVSTITSTAGASPLRLGAGEQVTIVAGEAPLEVLASPAEAAGEAVLRAAAVALDREALAKRDIYAIAIADIPEEGLPLAAATSTPSTLITELSKSATLDEPCDPITCNPVYQLPPPDACGVTPGVHCLR